VRNVVVGSRSPYVQEGGYKEFLGDFASPIVKAADGKFNKEAPYSLSKIDWYSVGEVFGLLPITPSL